MGTAQDLRVQTGGGGQVGISCQNPQSGAGPRRLAAHVFTVSWRQLPGV